MRDVVVIGLLVFVVASFIAFGIVSLVVWLLSLLFPFVFSWALVLQVYVVLWVSKIIVTYLLPKSK